MSTKFVVAFENQRTAPLWPLSLTAIGWLYLDRFDAPGWAYGVFWTVAALLFIGAIVTAVKQVERTPVWQKDLEAS